jgi:hypothetical protein
MGDRDAVAAADLEKAVGRTDSVRSQVADPGSVTGALRRRGRRLRH